MYHWLCCGSVTKSCPTLCDSLDCSMPGLPVPHCLPSLPKCISIESVMPSSYLISCVSIFYGLSVFFFWDSYDSNVGAFHIVPEVPEVVLISFDSFFLFSSLLHLFPPFYLLPHLSYLLSLFFYSWFPSE